MVNKTNAQSGSSRVEQQETDDGLVPRTPNEHDTSADSQSAQQGGNNSVAKAAAADASSGKPDTGTAPVMDQVYNDKVRGGGPKEGPRR